MSKAIRVQQKEVLFDQLRDLQALPEVQSVLRIENTDDLLVVFQYNLEQTAIDQLAGELALAVISNVDDYETTMNDFTVRIR